MPGVPRVAPQRSVSHRAGAVVGGGHRGGIQQSAGQSPRGTTPTCGRSASSRSCKRTLGFLSNFAVAFSYISVSTGTFTNQAVAFGVGGPAIFWAWPLVILGQTFVALNFAELASHFPVAGSIYQWSKRLSNRTLGWFTGWIYFWAGVITVTAVAATVPLVLSTIYPDRSSSPIRRRSPALDMQSFIGADRRWSRRRSSTSFGVRLLAIINNIGVGAEILGMLVFALILLFFANHQPLSVLFDTSYTSEPRRRRLLRRSSSSACSWPCSWSTGSTPPGRSVRRRSMPAGRRRAASCRRSGCRASSARSSCWR